MYIYYVLLYLLFIVGSKVFTRFCYSKVTDYFFLLTMPILEHRISSLDCNTAWLVLRISESVKR